MCTCMRLIGQPSVVPWRMTVNWHVAKVEQSSTFLLNDPAFQFFFFAARGLEDSATPGLHPKPKFSISIYNIYTHTANTVWS